MFKVCAYQVRQMLGVDRPKDPVYQHLAVLLRETVQQYHILTRAAAGEQVAHS